jgi:uridine kinase
MVVNKEFSHDIEQLVMGNSIKIPNKDKLISPTKFVIVEEPFGRGRQGMDKLVDFVVCLDTPLEIALARRLLEWTKLENDKSDQTLLKINGYLTQ